MKAIYLASTIIVLIAAAEFISHDMMLAGFVTLGFCALILWRGESEQYDNSTPTDL